MPLEAAWLEAQRPEWLKLDQLIMHAVSSPQYSNEGFALNQSVHVNWDRGRSWGNQGMGID